jgi:hypothetical protein
MVIRKGLKTLQIALMTAILISGVSCALYPSSNSTPVIKTCGVPSDQATTISGHWPVIPVPIAFHQGDFDASEMTDMSTAADNWNKFYTASQTITTIDTGGGNRQSSTTNPSTSGSLCATGLVPTNQFIGNVTIYKLAKWPAAYAASAIALTSFCVLPSKPFPRMYMAIMEVNYQGFFVEGAKQPDLQSIILHELGHLMGLNHSCEGFQKTGTPNCNDPNLNPDYSAASMYPVFTFDQSGTGQVKRSLGANDQSRANCLYGTAAAQ